jgi:hypothetical protein
LEGAQKQGKEKGTIADAAYAYYYLLKTVKCESKKDNIWMTFYHVGPNGVVIHVM